MRHRQEQQFAQTPEGQAYQQWRQPKLTAAAQAAKEELSLNPGLSRRPDERGEAGFTSWQSRMRDLRSEGLNTTPPQSSAQEVAAQRGTMRQLTNPGLTRREAGSAARQAYIDNLRAKGPSTVPAQQPAQAASPPATPAAGGMPGGTLGRKAALPTPAPTIGTTPIQPKNAGGAPPASGQGKGGTPVVARPATNPGQGSNQTPYS